MEILTLSILSFVSGLFTAVFQSISGIIEGAFTSVFQAFGQNAGLIANNFAMDLNSFGPWSPIILVLLFGTFGIMAYLLFMGAAVANDLT